MHIYSRECCPGCGIHESILADPEHHGFTFEERYCAVCKAQSRFQRIVADRHDRTDKKNKVDPENPRADRSGDGHHWYTRRMTADELERRRSHG